MNLIDTAEQYPIPSNGRNAKEWDTELLIGDWMRDRGVPRSDVLISTKITGGRNVTPRNIRKDCEGSLQRLYRYRTDAAQEAIRDYAALARANQMSLNTTIDQLRETMEIVTMKDPLSEDLMWEDDRAHMRNRLPLFSSNRVGRQWYGEGEIVEPIP